VSIYQVNHRMYRHYPRLNFALHNTEIPSIWASITKIRIDLPRKARNISISAVSLLILLLVSGTIYTLVNDHSSDKVTSVSTPSATTSNQVIKPVQPAANVAEGVALEFITSPVTRGSQATIEVNTNALSSCSITVTYNNVPAVDPGLKTQAADAYGAVGWTWDVSQSAPIGTWPVKITCIYHGRSGVYQANLQVTS